MTPLNCFVLAIAAVLPYLAPHPHPNTVKGT